MIRPFLVAAAAGVAFVAAVATISPQPAPSSNAAIVQDRLAPSTLASAPDVLVPAGVCADARDEASGDCLPWSKIGENVLLATSAQD